MVSKFIFFVDFVSKIGKSSFFPFNSSQTNKMKDHPNNMDNTLSLCGAQGQRIVYTLAHSPKRRRIIENKKKNYG